MFYPTEIKTIGLKKEATRGVAETTIAKYLAVEKASEFEYKLNLIEDEMLRGTYERYEPIAGTKEGTGKFTIDLDAMNCGEIFYSLLGSVNTQLIGTNAYRHIFTRDLTNFLLPSYTFFIRRADGTNIKHKAYSLSVVKSVAISGAVDGKARLDADIIFQKEQNTNATFNPQWTDISPFMFYQTQIKINDTLITNVRNWTLNIDNQANGIRTFNQSQDITDILATNKLLVNGTFELYFENEVERAKFLNNEYARINIILIGKEIETGIHYQLEFVLPRIHYSAFPFQDMDGLLGSAVAFSGYRGITEQNSISVQLTNIETGY